MNTAPTIPVTSRSALLALALAGFCALSAASAGAAAPEDAASPQAVIETRQASLKKMGAAMKAIVEQLKSDAPDNARMAAAVQVISTGAEALPRWFPAGSGAEAGIETDALPYIWKDRAKFESLANRLVPETKTWPRRCRAKTSRPSGRRSKSLARSAPAVITASGPTDCAGIGFRVAQKCSLIARRTIRRRAPGQLPLQLRFAPGAAAQLCPENGTQADHSMVAAIANEEVARAGLLCRTHSSM